MGFLVYLHEGGVVGATERYTCPGCNLQFGGAEKKFTFQGGTWHRHCLIAHANKQLMVLDPAVRIRNWRRLSDRVSAALREVASMAKARQKELATFIKFCVDFLLEAAQNPNAIPAEFRPELATA